MSEDQPSPPKKRKCDKCNRKINTSRFEIHYAKCQPKKKGKAAKEQAEAILKSENAEKVGVKKKEEEMGDTFPCYLCGFEMRITDLDSHPLRCTNREVSCWFCYVKFPVSIMANHEEVCPRKLRMEAENRVNAPVAVVVPPPPKPPVAIEAPVVPPKPAEIVVIPPKPAENHISIPPKPDVRLDLNPPRPVESVFSNAPKPMPAERQLSNPPKPIVQAPSIPPLPSTVVFPNMKPVEPFQIPQKQPQSKPAPIKPAEHPTAPPKTVSIPNKPPFNPYTSLPKHNAPQKPINRPTVATAARNVEQKSNKSVPKPEVRPNEESKKNLGTNHKEKEKIPQMKVEKEAKSQIGQKENAFKKVNNQKASTQSSTQASSSNIFSGMNTNVIKDTHISTSSNPNVSSNPNPNVSSNLNPNIRTNNISSSSSSSISTNSFNSSSDPAFELPRRFQEVTRIIRQQTQMLNNQRERVQRINRLIQENANRRRNSKDTGLPSSLIQLIPEKKYVFNIDDMECSICCIEFQPNQKLKDLKCRHNYHSKCISQWLKINRSCPLCKTDLSVNIPYFVQEKPVPPSKQTFASYINT